MKICILRHSYFPMDPRVRKEAYALKDQGHSVDIICLLQKNKEQKTEVIDGINVYRIPLSHERKGIFRYFFEYGLSLLIFTLMITYRQIRHKYEYIQVNTMPDLLVFSTLIARLFGAKIILDVHEPTPELWVTKFADKHKALYNLQKNIEQAAIRYSHHSLTVTEAMKVRLTERGAENSKITVIPNVCEEVFSDYYVSDRIHPQKHGFKLITHGSIEERYGHDIIIRAVCNLKESIPGISLEIFGKGEYENELRALVDGLKCGDFVNFRGYLPFKDMLDEISMGDVGIIAMKRSPYSELIDTNKLYEYISMGIPVIQSRLPAVEYNFDDHCLEYFEPDNAADLQMKIYRLFQEPERRRTIAQNAHARMDAFRWNVVKKTYTTIFS